MNDHYETAGINKDASRDIAKQQLKEPDCFFSAGLKGDGKPYYYNMHKTTGIAGGTGPMGSIRSKSIRIPVPRSKKAMKMHITGFTVKLIFLILSVTYLKINPFPESGIWVKIVVAFGILISGGLVTHIIYRITGIRSKLLRARKYSPVRDYRKKGYSRGIHPMISTTPAGIIIYILRWLL